MPVRQVKNTWTIDIYFGGERCRRRSPLNTKEGALAYEMFMRKECALHGSITAVLRANTSARSSPCPTLYEFSERWFKGYVIVNNRPQEQRMKRRIFDAHILPVFGHLRLCDIGPEEIEQYKGEKRQTNLAAKTINNHLAVLHRCLMCAKDWKVLKTEVPRIPLLRAAEPTFHFLSPEDCEKLLGAVSDEVIRTMILTGIQTGMRFCELTALRWKEVDLDKRFVTVCRSIVNGYISPPKNNRVRHIPLTDTLTEALASLPRTCELVFHKHEKIISYNHAWEKLREVSVAAGIEHTSWHDLRHTFASQLVGLGASLLAVQNLLGHSSIQITMRYSHLGKDMLRDAVQLLDKRP